MATIGEFIAKLGFKVDKKSSSEFDKSFKDKEKGTKKFGETFKKTAKDIEKSAQKMAVILVSNVKRIDDFTNKVILKTKQLSQKAVLMATGFYGVLSGITFGIGKLIKNYLQMDRAIEDSNAPPKLQKQAEIINSISKNVNNLKKTFSNFLNWIGYFLIKDLQEPLRKVNNFLMGTDKLLKNNIKKSAENVSKFLGYFLKLLVNNLQFVIGFVKKLSNFFLDVAKSVDKTKLAWVGFVALLLINPVFAVFTAMMLLIDDFIVHINGGESALGDLWDKLIGWYKELENSGAIDRFKEVFVKGLEKVGAVIETVFKKIGQFITFLATNKTANSFFTGLMKAILRLMIISKIIVWIQKIVAFLKPIIDIIIAIASALTPVKWAVLAIIGVIAIMVKHWDKFKVFFIALWEGLKSFLLSIWEGISNIVKNVVNGIVNFFTASWNGLKNIVKAFADFYFGIWANIWNKTKEIISKIKDFFVDAFKKMKENASDLLNKFSFGLLGRKKDNTTKGQASGGIVSSEGTYRIAENNQPEAIIPLSQTKRGRALGLLNRVNEFMNIPKIVKSTNTINRQIRNNSNINNVSTNNQFSININVTGNQNPTDIAREVEKAIKKVQNNSLMDRYKNGIQMSNVGGNVI